MPSTCSSIGGQRSGSTTPSWRSTTSTRDWHPYGEATPSTVPGAAFATRSPAGCEARCWLGGDAGSGIDRGVVSQAPHHRVEHGEDACDLRAVLLGPLALSRRADGGSSDAPV